MKISLLSMLTSKKFIAAIVAVLVYLAGILFGADKETIDHIYQAILVYVGAQGIADAGKSAAQIRAVAENAGSAGMDQAVAASAMNRVASQVGVVAGALIIVCALGIVAQAGCSREAAGRATSVGISTGIDCEAAHFDEKVLADARVLADAKVAQWLAGAERPSSEKIRSELAPLRSGLARCAIAAAVAAAISLGTAPQPPAGASSLASSRTAGSLRESFSEAKGRLGWGEIRLSGGTVI